MKVDEINKNITELQKELEDRKYQRKRIAEAYDELIKRVRKSGIIALICLVLQVVLFTPGSNDRHHLSLAAFSRSMTPIMIIGFIASFGYFVWKGYDLLLNSNTDIGNKLADKRNKTTTPISLVLDELNNEIMNVENALQKYNDKLYESGGVYKEPSKKGDMITKAPEKYEARVIERTIIEKKPISKPVEESFESDSFLDDAKDSMKNIDDILNGLDSTFLDDEDEFETSESLWKKDTKGKYDID